MGELQELRAENARLKAILDSPLYEPFLEAVEAEAQHQIYHRDEEDAAKGPEDWFWLIGYLAGKLLRACHDRDKEKAQHHTISSAAVLLNWHRHITEGGLDGPEE